MPKIYELAIENIRKQINKISLNLNKIVHFLNRHQPSLETYYEIKRRTSTYRKEIFDCVTSNKHKSVAHCSRIVHACRKNEYNSIIIMFIVFVCDIMLIL